MKRLHSAPGQGQDPVRKRLTLTAILLGAAILLLLTAAILLFTSYSAAGEPPDEPASFCYQLGVYEDRIAVFTGGQLKPSQVLDIPLSALPEGDQQLLREGIPLRSEEELRRAIEDYS